uniref:DUF2063 domain-containing protein n=1 Tax=Macrostomum lignano TaxID=282301 RepID=A0A1I8F1N0_9PLAT
MSALIRQWRLQSGTYEYVMKYFSKLGQYNFLVDVPVSQLMQFFQTDVDRVNFSQLAPYFFWRQFDRVFACTRATCPPSWRRRAANLCGASSRSNTGWSLIWMIFCRDRKQPMHDALHMLALGLQAATRSKNIQPTPLNCRRRNLWSDGATLVNYVVASSTSSNSDAVRSVWTIWGFRSDFNLLIEERLPYTGAHQLGYWAQRGG